MMSYNQPWPYGLPPYPAWYPQSAVRKIHEQPLTFVLLHGAWADANFWDGIAAELRRRGHKVYVPEYPGHGKDSNKAVTHAKITKSVVDYITSRNLQQIILVGHSFGGTIVQKVAEQIPDRLKRLVFMNAFVLKDGESVADEVPPEVRALFELARKQSSDDTVALPYPVFRETFANLATTEQAQFLYKTQTPPEPAVPLFEKLDLKKFYTLTTPRSYIFLNQDTALPQYNNDYGWHPHMSSRLGLFRYIEGQGDHMTTYRTEPRLLAQKIVEASRD